MVFHQSLEPITKVGERTKSYPLPWNSQGSAIALLIDDLMLIMFGRGSNKQGYNDVGVLSTSTWSWKSRYTSNPAWLSGNLSASHGVVKNSTGTYGGDTRSNSRDPDSAPSFPVFKQDNTTLSNTTSETPHEHRGRITAGIIAGVISGGVVVVCVCQFLLLYHSWINASSSSSSLPLDWRRCLFVCHSDYL